MTWATSSCQHRPEAKADSVPSHPSPTKLPDLPFILNYLSFPNKTYNHLPGNMGRARRACEGNSWWMGQKWCKSILWTNAVCFTQLHLSRLYLWNTARFQLMSLRNNLRALTPGLKLERCVYLVRLNLEALLTSKKVTVEWKIWDWQCPNLVHINSILLQLRPNQVFQKSS